jgi:hypothetical protein
VWVPLFPFWLLLILVGAVLFPLVVLAGFALGISAVRAYATGWRILSAMKHTLVEVDDPEVHVRLSFA